MTPTPPASGKKKEKIYYLTLQCAGFQNYAVRASSKKEAEDKAIGDFQCDCQCAELVEFSKIPQSTYYGEQDIRELEKIMDESNYGIKKL